jgi:hypothetical protein
MTNLFILKMKKLKTFCAVAKIELKKIADNVYRLNAVFKNFCEENS